MYEAVLFDFDDTLVDTRGSKIPAIIEYCRTVHGADVSFEIARETKGARLFEAEGWLWCSSLEEIPRALMPDNSTG